MFNPGDKVTWLYTPRGGYGYVIPVDGVVIKVNRSTVRIKVKNRSCVEVERNVRPENLKPRKE